MTNQINPNLQAYDKLADIYDTEVFTSIFHQHWDDKTLSLIKQWGALSTTYPQELPLAVDLGCGTGRYANLLLEQGYHVIGVDQSAPMLQVAAQNLSPLYGNRFTPIMGDVVTFQEPDKKAVLTICFGAVLNHLEVDRWPMFIQKVHSLLANDGLLLLDLENPLGIDYLFYTLYAYLKRMPNKPTLKDVLQGGISCKLLGRPYAHSPLWTIGSQSVRLDLHYKPLWSVKKLLRSSGFRILTVEGTNIFSCAVPRVALSEYEVTTSNQHEGRMSRALNRVDLRLSKILSSIAGIQFVVAQKI